MPAASDGRHPQGHRGPPEGDPTVHHAKRAYSCFFWPWRRSESSDTVSRVRGSFQGNPPFTSLSSVCCLDAHAPVVPSRPPGPPPVMQPILEVHLKVANGTVHPTAVRVAALAMTAALALVVF